jgi:hypothetical protein
MLITTDEGFILAAPFRLRRKVRSPALSNPVCNFLTQTTNDLSSSPIIESQQKNNESAGGQSAEITKALNQNDLGTVASRSYRSRNASRTTANDEDFSFGSNRS